MKKIVVLLAVFLLMFSACNKPTVVEVDNINPTDNTQTQPETDKPTEEPTPEPTPTPTEEPTPEPTPEPEPLPVTVAVVVARDGYADSELNPVLDALTTAGYEPVILSDQMGTANGFGETREVENTFNDFVGDDLRGIVLIGGSESLWDNTDLHRLLNEVYALDRVVASICLSTVTLAKAGILNEGDEASWFMCDSSNAEMTAAGVVDSGKDVTVADNIITANGPPAAQNFATEIVSALDSLE